jgi:hypothetical protein
MRHHAAMWRCVRVLVILTVFAVAPSDLRAQPHTRSFCKTEVGICFVDYAPVNAPCRCGQDRGLITMLPRDLSNACGTPLGVCREKNFLPIGSRCSCGRDSGQIIGR